MTELAPTIMEKSRHELEFEFESIVCNLQDTILIPIRADRDTTLEDMDLMDFGLVRYSGLFPLGYAGLIPMRFLQRWNDDDMYFENWAYGGKPKRITMEDIYSILADIDAFGANAPGNREEHAVFMGNMTKMRDFVAYVAEQERKANDSKEARAEIAAGKEEIGVKDK